jgi:hypothetical protein
MTFFADRSNRADTSAGSAFLRIIKETVSRQTGEIEGHCKPWLSQFTGFFLGRG